MALLVLGLVAVGAILASALSPLPSLLASVVAIVLSVRGAWRFVQPGLSLRLDEDGGLAWKRGQQAWSSVVQAPFVSPWFIGWRAGMWTAAGVFRLQLDPDAYRRLAVALRHAGEARSR